MTQHTPIPWMTRNNTIRSSDDEMGIALCHSPMFKSGLGDTPDAETAKSNAAMIVRAVNSHAALITALETIIEYGACEENIEMAKAAISKAKAKGE